MTDKIQEELEKEVWKSVFKYDFDILGKDLLMSNGTPRKIMEFGRKLKLSQHLATKQAMIKKIDEMIIKENNKKQAFMYSHQNLQRINRVLEELKKELQK